MIRTGVGGGVLLALPAALVPAGSFPAIIDEDAMIGSHFQLEVFEVRMFNTGVDQLGEIWICR